MKKDVVCPHCGKPYSCFRNPAPTADVIIHEPGRGVVIIRRRHTPIGFALPGGFIDEGEQAEEAAVREMREETGLDVELTGLLGVYSRPKRDPRQHTLTVVFTGKARNPDAICAGDDAAQAAFYPLDALPQPLVFDHAEILEHFRQALAGQRQVAAVQPLACHHLPDGNAGKEKSVASFGSDGVSTGVSAGVSTSASTSVSAAPATPATLAAHKGEKC
ncbi:NUDIX domain-containing protein [Desulfovibrio sp.]|uniref:NUDIX domain-containing protein n=1 Tax=Desulfovibrio sp. TaxID=885 RepID=UPI003D0EAF10